MKKSKRNVKKIDKTLENVFKYLKTIFHFIAAAQICYGIYYDYKYIEIPPEALHMHSPFGGKFKYLTFWDTIIQSLYFIISLINDFVGTNEVAPRKLPTIRKLKDFIFSALAFPLALNVGISFWSLYAIDRELAFPRLLNAAVPSWLNHVMHTYVVVFIVLEMFTSFREYPSRSKGLAGLTAFIITYSIWIHFVKHYSGFWPYPLLETLQLPLRIVFFIALIFFTACYYLLGEHINNKFWAKNLKIVKRKVK